MPMYAQQRPRDSWPMGYDPPDHITVKTCLGKNIHPSQNLLKSLVCYHSPFTYREHGQIYIKYHHEGVSLMSRSGKEDNTCFPAETPAMYTNQTRPSPFSLIINLIFSPSYTTASSLHPRRLRLCAVVGGKLAIGTPERLPPPPKPPQFIILELSGVESGRPC